MVKVNELRIDEKNKVLYVNLEISSIVDRITVVNLEDYINNNFENALVDIENDNSETYADEIILDEKYINKGVLVLSVYEYGKEVFRELVFPLETVYKKSICYLKELNSSCELPKGFIDYILLTEYIYRSKDYDFDRTLKYWNRLIANVKPENPCNCG